MRDLNRWKDKVELQLDGRQIFFLFFGSAVCACLIFVLGVVVGKRMEARVVAQSREVVEDPLAVLDELGNAEEGFTFHNALAERHEGRKLRAPGKDGSKEPGKDAPKESEKDEAVVASDQADEPKLKGDDKEPKADPARPDKGDKPDKGDRAEKKAQAAAVVKKPAVDDKAQALKADKAAADRALAQAADKAKGHFTLQLSAFATKTEAADLTKKLRDSGYKPFIVESTVPGKGLMYRVRLGDYGSRDTALTAKTDFERKQKMVAYVAKL